MSLSPTVLSGGGANSGAKVITPTAYKHGWLRREPSGPKKGGWRRCFCILWRLPSAAANEPFFLIYYPDRNAHKPDGFISTSSLSLSLLPPQQVVSVRRVLGMIDRWPLVERWLCVAGLGPGQYRVSMPPRKKDQEFLLRIDSSSAFGQPEPHHTTLPNPALHVPCAAMASCWALNDERVLCVSCCVLCVLAQRKTLTWQLAIVRKT